MATFLQLNDDGDVISKVTNRAIAVDEDDKFPQHDHMLIVCHTEELPVCCLKYDPETKELIEHLDGKELQRMDVSHCRLKKTI